MSTSRTTAYSVESSRQSILALESDKAKEFFLKQESFCDIEMPPYFRFDRLLMRVDEVLTSDKNPNVLKFKPQDYEEVNYLILNSKDGRQSWRPLQIIHPALYVSLINSLTRIDAWKTIRDRFAEFSALEKISCLSLPMQSLTKRKNKAEQVAHWWEFIEQRSIELALDYAYLIYADISDCYGSIYTHSVAWALHGKEVAKASRKTHSLLGNVIDKHLQGMHHGQTNGIPQGSVLMDFIAEMILGYADLLLDGKIKLQKVTDYRILRYRDDYRIFVNNPQDGERILKCLTEVLIDLGLRLNAGKAKASSVVIRDSLKPDKLAWISGKNDGWKLQQQLLAIYKHSIDFPNAGSLVAALAKFYARLLRYRKLPHPMPLISIVVDIAYRSPRAYPICSAILSKLLDALGDVERKRAVVEKIRTKFSQIPNTGHMEMWLQRISLKYACEIPFREPLCLLVMGREARIWNHDWIRSSELLEVFTSESIFDAREAEKLSSVIPSKEVDLFSTGSDY